MNSLLLTLLLAAPAAAECPAPAACAGLSTSRASCEKSPRACWSFLRALKPLLPERDCRREQDVTPVPALWLCDEKLRWDSLKLLSRLKFRGARELYASAELRAALDGELAEEHLEKSRALEAKLAAEKRP